MKIISVIPLKKSALRGDLTYFSAKDIPVGNIVTVPIRNQNVLALVTDSKSLVETKGEVKEMDFNLRKVSEHMGPSIFRKEYLESIFDSSEYFAQDKNSAITSLIPNIFIENYSELAKIKASPEGVKDQRDQRAAVQKNIPDGGKNLKSEKLLFQYPFADRISIYKTLVRESFARGRSIFLVLPAESDITKFTEHLSKGIEQFTFALHSGISAKKNLAACEKIISEAHPVLVVGTAPYLSIPVKDLGTIILEHESSGAFKMISRPYFDLRTFVELYASKINAKFILADEMLRYETIGRIGLDDLSPLHPLSFRIDFGGQIEIVPNEKSEDGKFRILKDTSLEEIKSALLEKKNVFIFSLRKGLATQTVCRDCSDTVSCEKCGAPLVLYLSHGEKKRMFVCNRCEEEKEGDISCATCGSWNLMPLGIGTDTVYEEVKKLFPKVPMFQLDKETAKTSLGAKKIVKEFAECEGAILIGTEMTFFYLRESVPLSIIASFDSLWSIPNFRMGEKIIHIILSALGNTNEKLIIQTKNENDNTIQAIKSGSLSALIREELRDRKKLDYPPFKRFIKITYLGDKEQTMKARKYLEEAFQEYSPEIFSGFISRLKGKYVTNALIKIYPEKWTLPEISAEGSLDKGLLAKLSSLPPQFEIHVDPEDLL